MVKEGEIEDDFIRTLIRLKYIYRDDILNHRVLLLTKRAQGRDISGLSAYEQ